MLNFFRKTKGSVSLILILIMLPMMTYATMIVDGVRVTGVKNTVSGAGDLTMNAALSTYDMALKNAYGMFAMCNNMDELQDAMTEYFTSTMAGTEANAAAENDYLRVEAEKVVGNLFNNLSNNGEFNTEEFMNYLSCEVNSISVSGNSMGNLANPLIMKNQILDYAKYQAPLSFVADIGEKLKMFSGTEKQTDAVNKKIEYTEKLNSMGTTAQDAMNAIRAYNQAVMKLDGTLGHNTGNLNDAKLQEIYSHLNNATSSLTYYRNLGKLWGADGIRSVSEPADPKMASYQMQTGENGEYQTVIKDNNQAGIDVTIPAEMVNSFNTKITIGKEQEKFVYEYAGTSNYTRLLTHKADYDTALGNLNLTPADISSYSKFLDELDTVRAALNNINAPEYSKECIVSMYNFMHSYKNEDIQKNIEISQKILLLKDERKAYQKTLNDLISYITDTNKKTYAAIALLDVDQRQAEIDKLQSDDQKKAYYVYQANWDLLQKFLTDNFPTCKLQDTGSGNTLQIQVSNSPKIEDDYYTDGSNTDLDSKTGNNNVGENINSFESKCRNSCQSYATDANNNLQSAYNVLKDFKEELGVVKTSVGAVSTNLTALQKSAKTVVDSRDSWNTAINDVNDGSTKNSMQADCDAEKEKIKTDEMNGLITLANAQKDAYEKLWNYLDGFTYYGKKVITDSDAITASELVTVDYAGGVTGVFAGSDSSISHETLNQTNVSAKSASLMSAHYKTGSGNISELVRNASDPTQHTLFNQFGFLDANEMKQCCGGNFTDEVYNKYLPYNYFMNGSDSAKNFYVKLITMTQVVAQKPLKASDGSEVKVTDKLTDVQSMSSGGNGEASCDINGFPNGEGEKIDTQEIKTMDGSGIKTEKGTVTDKGGITDNKNSQNTNFFTEIGKLVSSDNGSGFASNVIEKCMVEEYITNMFSCLTTNFDDGAEATTKECAWGTDMDYQNLALSSDNNAVYRAEQEYIVWGGNTPQDAVNKNTTTIYLVRFALNLIAAFTIGSVQQMANTIASTIAAACPFAIPLVQVLITIILAAAESAFDLHQLKQGKDVTVFKGEKTWTCSLNGLINFAKDQADTLISKGTDKATDFISNLAAEKIDDLSNNLQKYIDEQVDNAFSAVKTQVMERVKEMITNDMLNNAAKLSEDAGNYMQNLKSNLKGNVNQILGQIENDLAASTSNTLVQQAEQKAIQYIKQNLVDTFVTSITSELNFDAMANYAENVSKIQSKVEEKISDFFDDNVKAIKAPIETFIQQKSQALSNEVDRVVQEGGDKFSQAAKDKLSGMFQKLEGIEDTKKTDPKDASSGFTLNYKQYTKLFCLIQLVGHEEDVIKRIGNVVSWNMVKQRNDSDKYSDLQKCYTLVEIDADVTMKTIFSYDVTANSGREEEGLYSGLAPLWASNGETKLHYHSVLGY